MNSAVSGHKKSPDGKVGAAMKRMEKLISVSNAGSIQRIVPQKLAIPRASPKYGLLLYIQVFESLLIRLSNPNVIPTEI